MPFLATNPRRDWWRYILSAVIGVVICGGVLYLVGKKVDQN